jgi:ribosomal protein S18 acetylase RimI-like enzyme
VGLAHYRPVPRPLAASAGGYLDDLYVAPQARGSGVVDALLDRLREIARERGWTVVRWITADDNHRARAKYDQVATRTMWVTYDMAVEPPGSSQA